MLEPNRRVGVNEQIKSYELQHVDNNPFTRAHAELESRSSHYAALVRSLVAMQFDGRKEMNTANANILCKKNEKQQTRHYNKKNQFMVQGF